MLVYEVDANFLMEYGAFSAFSWEGCDAIIDFFNETDCGFDTKFDRSIAWCFQEYDSFEEWYEENVKKLDELKDEIKEEFSEDELTEEALENEVEERLEKAFDNVDGWTRKLNNGHFLIFNNC